MSHGILFTPPEPARTATLSQAAEEAGFDLLSFGDSQSLFRELYVTLSVAAQATSRIKLTPGVSNIITRHLAVTASAMATLDELSGGRAILGLGSGDSAIYNLQERPVRLADMEVAIDQLRHLFRGERVEYRGHQIHVGWSSKQIPIYMAAEGPKTLELAGKIADGVIVGCGLMPAQIDDAFEHLAAGAKRSGRTLDDIDVWFFAKANLSRDDRTAVDEIRMALAGSANHAFRFTSKGKGLPDELVPAVARLLEGYATHQHEQVEATNPNAKLVEDLGLVEYLAERFAVAGTPETVVARLGELKKHGVDKVLVAAITPDPEGFVNIWRDEVAPHIN